jgi:hypothetical protein
MANSFYKSSSPYNQTAMLNGYLDIINFRDIPVVASDVLFEITKQYEYRPDLLANDVYNDINLWWVFAVRNKSVLINPVFDMTAGTKIYIPQINTIKSVLRL